MLIAFAVLLCLALGLNARDWRMLALTCVVGVTLFLEPPRTSADEFYTFCFLAELTVAVIAFALRAEGSTMVIVICALMALTHLIAYELDGFPPLSPYRAIMPILEHLQVVACMAFSPVILPRLKNAVRFDLHA